MHKPNLLLSAATSLCDILSCVYSYAEQRVEIDELLGP